MPKSLQDHHNDGQAHGATGYPSSYDPPHDMVDEVLGIFGLSATSDETRHAENEAYNSGWNNAWKQR